MNGWLSCVGLLLFERRSAGASSSFPGQAHFALVLRSSGSPEIEEGKRKYRDRAQAAGIPVFDELGNAAVALSALSRFEAFRAGRKA